ncbi:MAG: hypothetical protein HN778_02915 [Prolixibacteraceae bacterium]|jgi:hypothetical protein|nr:hypothetical protein [Prolixibacteraceae bacterium]MBT6005922.1 hypothetical protein [Prolixibacteraceae bacterium]MBT6763430.1 hypothetical protein [Prolixibacteraceae bacterium]MBT6996896.1 hypothetical protein [Prolixibacteraceae bacterium]MBT7393763.1 hypothetical protein [Prolixibacteraceae bacterium]
MKKIAIVLVTLLIISVNLNAQENSITGKWLLTKVEAAGNIEEVYSEVIFKDDGYVEMEGRVFGNWVYKKKGKTVTIESEMIKEFAGERKISKLNENEMVLSGSEMKLFFKKMDQKTIETENKNSKLEGLWKVSVEDVDKILRFKLPDSFISLEKMDGAEFTSKGTWMYNSKEKSLIVMTSDDELRGLNTVVKITDTELELENKGNNINATKAEQKDIKVERPTFSDDDFYNENGDYKYEADLEKLPWKDFAKLIEYLSNINKLVYEFSALVEETESFDTKKLTANVRGSMNEGIYMDNIFVGFDTASLPENSEMPVAMHNWNNKLYPFESYTFRVLGEEEITSAAGTFNCTVIEAIGDDYENLKLWMINDKPGLLAKVIKDQPGDYGFYQVFELVEIELRD